MTLDWFSGVCGPSSASKFFSFSGGVISARDEVLFPPLLESAQAHGE